MAQTPMNTPAISSLRVLALAAGMALLPCVLPAQLLFRSGFDGAAGAAGTFAGWQTDPAGQFSGWTGSNRRYGSYGMGTQLTYGQYQGGRVRQEAGPSFSIGSNLTTRWWGFSVMIPSDYPVVASPDDTIIHQVKQGAARGYDAGEGPKSPFIDLRVRGSQFVLLTRMDPNANSRNGGAGDGGTIRTTQRWTRAITRGQWYDFVFQATFDCRSSSTAGATGHIRMWVNGSQVVNNAGGIGYNDGEYYFMKIGIYKPTWPSNAESSVKVYHDNLRVAHSGGSYGLVVPQAPE